MTRRNYITNTIAILLTIAIITFIFAILSTDKYINSNADNIDDVIIYWSISITSSILFLVYNNKYNELS